MPPACACRLISSPSMTRPQSEYGQAPSPRDTVPGDCSRALSTTSNSHTRPAEPGPDAGSGFSRTPVPPGASRQLGESGTRPVQ